MTERKEETQSYLSQALRWNEGALSNRLILNPAYWLIPIVIWSAIVATSLYHNLQEIDVFSNQTASNKGRFVFQMIEDMRLWNARHGGVYVDETDTTPSNPFLKVPDKDIVTTEGRKLTKINPAYMTRQLAGIIRENSKTIVNITSLKPINPINIADQWEAKALKSFENGLKETYNFITIGNINLFRYMAPLITKRACLQCHRHQGYKVGDVRGGISISFDSSLFLAINKQQKQTQIVMHLAAWVLLSFLTLVALWRLRLQIMALIGNYHHQEELVSIRTKDLHSETQKRLEAEAQFRRFIDATQEGIVALDLDGIATFANPKAARLLGLSGVEDIMGRDFHKLSGHIMHQGSTERTDCPILNCIKNGAKVISNEEFFKRENGEIFPVQYAASPVFDDQKRIGAILTFNDISEAKARESELLKLSTAVDNSPASTLITDRDGHIEYVNKRFSEITGYKEEEVLGKNPRILKSGHTNHDVYDDMWKTINQGHLWKGELFNRKKDGSLFWEESLIAPIVDQHGEITHFVAVKRDITEYKTEMNEVWRQANYDALTKLPNRNLFEDRLDNAVGLAGRENRMLALLFIDLDGFKKINDVHGHQAGDTVLATTAQRLSNGLRHSDTAARLGGDEFVIILQDAHSIEAVENVATKIIEELAKGIPYKGNVLNVTASLGISMMPRDSNVASELLRYADIAMYSAKQEGKNCFCHYSDVEICKPATIT